MKSSIVVSVLVLGLWLPTLPALADDAGPESSVAVITDNSLQFRVSSALHSDPYLYARHIDVYVKDGDVVLKGFVASEWELAKALRIATEAAKPRKVVDTIEISEGGRR